MKPQGRGDAEFLSYAQYLLSASAVNLILHEFLISYNGREMKPQICLLEGRDGETQRF